MKKLFTMIMMAVVLFTACTNEDEPTVEQIVTIQATIAHDSRVALGDTDEKKVNWTAGDIINLTINEIAYSFTWQEGTTFAYIGNASLPSLTPGTQITATYVSTFNATQSGLKEDVGSYMALSATEKVQTELDYNDLNLTFFHGTSVLKLTLSNDAFKNRSVTDITVKAGTTVVASTTATFTGDSENGRVTAYLAIQPATLENITLHATCNGNTYTNSLANKTVEAGKIYLAEKNLPYAYVDLGLPSGTKWASFNVGATSAEEAGGYFAWGEIETKEKYGYADYKYLQTSYLRSFTKYCNSEDYGYDGFTDNLTTLESIDDAATANWGNNWRMPTSAEMQELLDNCTWTWTTLNEVSGCMITSKVEGYTDKSIFIPAAGYKDNTGTLYSKNEYGYYWSNSLNADYLERGDPSNADYLPIFQPGSEWWQQIMIFPSVRTDGSSVRPVYIGY